MARSTNADTDFGTFTKDGETRHATSQKQRIDLLYKGWAEQAGPSKEAEAAVAAATEPQRAAKK